MTIDALPRRSYLVTGGLLLATIAAGLASRRFPALQPSFVARYAGDALWAAMVFWALWVRSGGEINHAYLVDGNTRKVMRLDAVSLDLAEVGTVILPTIPKNPSTRNNLANWLAGRYEQALSRSPLPPDEAWNDVDRTQNAWTPWPTSQTGSP